MRRVAAVAALVLGLLAFSTATASAEAPLRVTGQITDPAGALGAQTPAVQAALDRLTAESNLRLYVVYVQNFSGRDGQDWADRSAQASQLGRRDALLAVAIDDRAYGISLDETFPLSDQVVTDIETRDVRPRLTADDWGGAAIALADGMRTGEASGGSGGDAGGAALPVGLVAGGVALVGGGAYVLARRRRRNRAEPAGTAPAPPTLPGSRPRRDHRRPRLPREQRAHRARRRRADLRARARPRADAVRRRGRDGLPRRAGAVANRAGAGLRAAPAHRRREARRTHPPRPPQPDPAPVRHRGPAPRRPVGRLRPPARPRAEPAPGAGGPQAEADRDGRPRRRDDRGARRVARPLRGLGAGAGRRQHPAGHGPARRRPHRDRGGGQPSSRPTSAPPRRCRRAPRRRRSSRPARCSTGSGGSPTSWPRPRTGWSRRARRSRRIWPRPGCCPAPSWPQRSRGRRRR